MNLVFQDIVIIGIAIILAIAVLRFIGKIVVKLAMFGAVVFLGIYMLFYWHGGLLDLGNQDFMLYELRDKYCNEQVDPIKCDCIIKPIYSSIHEQYTKAQIEKLKKNKLRSLEVIIKTASRNKNEIKACLKENGALEKWDEFIDDLTTMDISKKLKDVYKGLKE